MIEDISSLQALYPNLNSEELAIAKENLDRYLALAWEILEDSHFDPADEQLPGFPESTSRGNIQERSIPNKPNHPTNL